MANQPIINQAGTHGKGKSTNHLPSRYSRKRQTNQSLTKQVLTEKANQPIINQPIINQAGVTCLFSTYYISKKTNVSDWPWQCSVMSMVNIIPLYKSTKLETSRLNTTKFQTHFTSTICPCHTKLKTQLNLSLITNHMKQSITFNRSQWH